MISFRLSWFSRSLVAGWLCCGFAAMAAAGASAAAASAGAVVIDESDYGSFTLSDGEAGRVKISEEAGEGPGFSRILRIETRTEGGDNFPKVSGVLRHDTALARGEVLLARFYLRTAESPRESGEGWTQFELEDNETFTISGQFSAHAAGEWREIWVPLRLARECPPGRATINFRVGDQRQIIEIGGLRVERKGVGVPLTSLPATPVLPSYEGIEPDAPWRAEARERIERLRKSELRIQVVDDEGRTLPGAQVHVRQLGHAYRFGAAIRADLLTADSARGERYRADVLRLFPAVTFENDLKWSRWIRDRETPQKAARWTEANHIALRGHTLVWASTSRMPKPLEHLIDEPVELGRAVDHHIEDIVGVMSPRVAVWDVLNEPFRNHDFMRLLGDEAMANWFKIAAKAAPEAKMFVNDYGIISGGGMDEVHQASYERNVEYLLSKGAPLGGLGFQGHFGRILTSPSRLWSILDRYGRFGLGMELTEYSTQIPDPEFNATYLRDMLTAFFSHPQTEGFILWGFQRGAGYDHDAVLLDKRGELTPAGKAWTDLIFKEWWTDETAVTGPDGTAMVRGFHGRYQIDIMYQSKTTSVIAELSPGGKRLRITLAPSVPVS